MGDLKQFSFPPLNEIPLQSKIGNIGLINYGYPCIFQRAKFVFSFCFLFLFSFCFFSVFSLLFCSVFLLYFSVLFVYIPSIFFSLF